jgi:hypothetical protein
MQEVSTRGMSNQAYQATSDSASARSPDTPKEAPSLEPHVGRPKAEQDRYGIP